MKTRLEIKSSCDIKIAILFWNRFNDNSISRIVMSLSLLPLTIGVQNWMRKIILNFFWWISTGSKICWGGKLKILIQMNAQNMIFVGLQNAIFTSLFCFQFLPLASKAIYLHFGLYFYSRKLNVPKISIHPFRTIFNP